VRTASGTLSLCTSLGSKRRSRTFFSNFTTRCATQAESWHHATRNLASSSTGGDYLELLVLHRALAWNVDRSCVLGKMQSYGHHDMPLLLALKEKQKPLDCHLCSLMCQTLRTFLRQIITKARECSGSMLSLRVRCDLWALYWCREYARGLLNCYHHDCELKLKFVENVFHVIHRLSGNSWC
jgi:hypothetical protein